MPVPALACSRVRTAPRASCHSATIAATRGFTDVTLSSGNGGRGENGSWLPSSACRSMWSTRRPAVIVARGPRSCLTSPNAPN